MTFVDPAFLVFLPVVWIGYWSLPHRWQNPFLTLASLLFYGWIHPWFAALMIASATIDWWAALRIEADRATAGRWMGISVASAVLLLGTFKYFDFFVENVQTAMTSVGLSVSLPLLRLALPAGISFYTFQTLSYTIDVYKGKLRARSSYGDYLLFVTFFPQLVAGPIERAENLLTQVEQPRRMTLAALRSGVSLGLWGAIKKVVVADTLAPYVDQLFAADHPAVVMGWAGALGFHIQMFADFTSYTDMARGSARLLGFELMQNFRQPMLARNPPELWDRWHISLSTWLRDYVYFPLANSKGLRRWLRLPGMAETGLTTMVRATLLTMLFSGLWHGAAWHFVVWGLYWGVLSAAWLVAERKFPKVVRKHRNHWYNCVWMFALGVAANLIFREPSMERLVGFFTRDPFDAGPEQLAVAGATVAVTLLGASVLCAGWVVDTLVLPRLRGTAWWVVGETTFWSVAVLVIAIFGRSSAGQFLYFAF